MQIENTKVQDIYFTKMHGSGNDFVIIDGRNEDINIEQLPISKICDRRLGVGCDQLIILKSSNKADAEMLIFNQDGSQASACGNASRCVARMIGGDEVVLQVAKRKLIAKNEADGSVTVDMGKPALYKILNFDPKIDNNTISQIKECKEQGTMPIVKNESSYNIGYLVDVGNLHLVFFTDSLISDYEAGRIGSYFEQNGYGQERVNVNFAHISGKDKVELKVWEKGVGLTHACGTGACATAFVANKHGHISDKAKVHMPGGILRISIEGENIMLNGDAVEVSTGQWNSR